MPDLGVSASVTSYGRDMIQLCETVIAEKYPGSVTVYGDTGEYLRRDAPLLGHEFLDEVDLCSHYLDSVMVKFAGVTDMEAAIRVGKEAADLLTARFRAPIRLEFEKVFFPFLLVNKKRYAGLHWESADKPKYINRKGLESVRRDNCPLVPKIQNEVLRLLLEERDPQGAIDAAKKVVSDLLQHRVPIEDLVISKAYTKPASEYAAVQAHIVLAEKMQRRDPATAPQVRTAADAPEHAGSRLLIFRSCGADGRSHPLRDGGRSRTEPQGL